MVFVCLHYLSFDPSSTNTPTFWTLNWVTGRLSFFDHFLALISMSLLYWEFLLSTLSPCSVASDLDRLLQGTCYISRTNSLPHRSQRIYLLMRPVSFFLPQETAKRTAGAHPWVLALPQVGILGILSFAICNRYILGKKVSTDHQLTSLWLSVP